MKDEMKGQGSSKKLKKKSPLYRLDPFVDHNGVLCVGGKLDKTQEFPVDIQHPVILPYKSHITTLIIRDADEKWPTQVKE